MTINNLYVTYDDDGKHFHINDEEVSEDVWMQQHPHMKKGQGSGGNSDSGGVGWGSAAGGTIGGDGSGGDAAAAEEEIRQGIRDHRAKLRAEAQQSGSPGDEMG